MTRRIAAYVSGAGALLILAPASVSAHPHHGVGEGFVHGFLHPFHGLDHILAMVAVGLMAYAWGGRAAVGIPVGFVAMAAVGWALGFGGLAVPHVEPIILASVVGLGLMVALGRRVPLVLAVGLLAAFGAAHGMAHGSEIPGAAVSSGVGLVLATALLHGAGIGIGAGLAALNRAPVIRYAGGTVALIGGLLILLWRPGG
jgi:urease accessory protein